MNMNQLRSLAKGCNLRGCSKLRKADIINFLRENEPSPPPAKDELPMGFARAPQGPIEQP